MQSPANTVDQRRLAMQSSTTEKVKKYRKARRFIEYGLITNKENKMRRRNQRLHRAIKEGEYQESNSVRQEDNE